MAKLFSFAVGFAVADGARLSQVVDLDVSAGDCPTVGSKYVPDMKGQDRTRETNWHGCQGRCADTTGCAYFSFWPDGGCHIQDESARQKPSWTGSSGPVSCPTTLTTTTSLGTAQSTEEKVDSLTKWFKSMDGGNMIFGAGDKAVRTTNDNPDLDVGTMKSLSAFFRTMDGGHHIGMGKATDKALKELKTQPALNVEVLKALSAYFRSHSGGFQIKSGQATNTALSHLRKDYGPFLLVSEVKSLGIEKAVVEAEIRLDDSMRTHGSNRYFAQKIGKERACIHGVKVRGLNGCQHAVPGRLNLKWTGVGEWDDRPTGCIQNAAGEVFYNVANNGAWNIDFGLICQRPKPDTLLCSCNAGQKTYKCEGHEDKSGKCKSHLSCTKSGSWYFPALGLRSEGICTK